MKARKVSLAVLALLASSVYGVSIKADIGIGNDLSELSEVDALSEATRYVNSNGEFINLAETEGHARLVLTQVRKYDKPMDAENVELDCDKTPRSLMEDDGSNHCPINHKGPSKVHL